MKQSILKSVPFWLAICAVCLMAGILHPIWAPDRVLMTTDDGIGAVELIRRNLPEAFVGGWNDSVLVGTPMPISLSWTSLLYGLMPSAWSKDLVHAIDVLLASFFMVCFLRRRKLVWPAAILGALTVFWLGSNFTLIYAGHTGKFGVLVFAAAALLAFDYATEKKQFLWGVLAGGALGGMFLEQADLALFFALCIGPYLLFRIWQEHGGNVKAWSMVLVPVLLFAFVLAARPLLSGYENAVKDVGAVNNENAHAKWSFVTQWSWPPEESIDFVAPGFMGWRSNEPEGPYWGRMGRSDGWEKTGQGFRNFKLESQYLGAVSLVLALWAIALGWASSKRDDPMAPEIRFWSLALLLTLLLSFGKYTPLYRLFYMLPLVSNIRNPNKFLQVFQLALGILSAFGLHRILVDAPRNPAVVLRWAKRFAVATAVLTVLFLLVAAGTSMGAAGLAAEAAADGWGAYGKTIIHNRATALFHASIFLALTTAVLWWRIKKRTWPKPPLTLGYVLVAVVALDAVLLSTHYVASMDVANLKQNSLARFLKQNTKQDMTRIALVNQDGFYNYWLTYLFPYHDIPTLNITQMPRMPDDYKAFLSAVGRNPLRMWALGSVKYVLGDVGLWKQIQGNAATREQFDMAMAYNVVPDGDSLRVVPGDEKNPPQHVVVQIKHPSSRFNLVFNWEAATDEEALAYLAGNEPLFATAKIAPEYIGELVDPIAGSGPGGSLELRSYKPGHRLFKVSLDRPAILRSADKYDPSWVARVDGKPVPVVRLDYIFQGVQVPAGLHEVEISFRPPRLTFYVQLAGLLLCGLAAMVLFGLNHMKRKA